MLSKKVGKPVFDTGKVHCNISTIGHIDHGKTTLTAAITHYLSLKYPDLNQKRKYEEIDSAPEEKTRGITINAAHIEYQTPTKHYSHIDCPGHADYIKNMIIGSSQIDCTILVVAVGDGVMPQTSEHVRLASRIGIPKIIVFINKMDTMPDDEKDIAAGLVIEELEDLLKENNYDPNAVKYIAGSAFKALQGDEEAMGQISELIDVLEQEANPSPEKMEKPFFMQIEDHCSIMGRGTVAVGRIRYGKVISGKEYDLLGWGSEPKRKITILGIESFKKSMNEARAGDDVGLLIRGIKREEIQRGYVICEPNTGRTARIFVCSLYANSADEGGRRTGFCKGYSPQMYMGTLDVTIKISEIEEDEIVMPGTSATVRIEAIHNIPIDISAPLILREGGSTVAIAIINKIIE